MSNPYTATTVTGYNSSPPPDDGTQVAANQLSWASHISKIGDPLKTAFDTSETNTQTAFNGLDLNQIRSISANDNMVAADERKFISCTNTITYTLLAAVTAADGYTVTVYNAGTGVITIEGNTSELVNGGTSFLLSNQYDAVKLRCDGAAWNVVSEFNVIITTRGDIIRGSSTGLPERLAIGASGTFLTSDGTDVSWGLLQPILGHDFLTATGAWTRDDVANTTIITVRSVGGGGAGGGCVGGSGDTLNGGGGGAGGEAFDIIDVQDRNFDPADVNTGTEVITLPATTFPNAQNVRDGTKCQVSTTGTLPSPLAVSTDYWVVGASGNTIQLSATKGGAAIDLTTQGTGTHTLELVSIEFAIGAGGTGSTANGNAGGNTVFGEGTTPYHTATGGGGGRQQGPGGTGGVPTGAFINKRGASGSGGGDLETSGTGDTLESGTGASSWFGGGPPTPISTSNGTAAGANTGAGGSGAVQAQAASANVSGGAGGSGAILVTRMAL